jgi:hypothetical protein
MFHWICPECGREVAPQAKECAACDPLAAAAADVAVAARPEQKAAPRNPAPLQPRVAGAPKAPASALPLPVPAAGRDVAPAEAASPVAQPPKWKQALPEPEPARAPQIANAPMREPKAAALVAPPSQAVEIAEGPQFAVAAASLPAISAAIPSPPLAKFVDYGQIARSLIKSSIGDTKPAASAVQEQLSLPGPTLPHELTSLHAAGIAKILVAGEPQAVAARRGSSWLLSFTVAAAVLAGTLGAVFYAMPGLASSPAPPRKTVAAKAPKEVPDTPEPPASSNPLARVVEVTGIRFVTDVPGQSPQIHYLVVNHSNVPLMGVTVTVTLRAAGTESNAPLSQFAFRAPRLGAYESKEMVSSIERVNRPITLPNWRDLRTEIQIAQ